MVLAACTVFTVNRAEAQAVPVTIEKTADGWRVLRGGKPFRIQAGGGSTNLDTLKAAGGNAVRTWGADNLDSLLVKAQQNGIGVIVGIWLGHERHGFDYKNADQVAQQFEMVRTVVEKYKNHPAVLAWGLGNEMEGYDNAANASIWSHIEACAALVKRLDPNHPTMTVTAEIGGERVKNIHRLCPSIDIMGINSYAGAVSLPDRYRKAGGTKPYIVTEFGPPGPWESGKTPWNAAIELTSTEKAEHYRKSWMATAGKDPLCVGGCAFLWGNKQEATSTWFGMLLPTGEKLGAVDVMTELWTGSPASDRCPTIAKFALNGASEGEPGATLTAALNASDPEGKPLKVEWQLQAEQTKLGQGGDAESVPPFFPEAIVKSDTTSATVKLPTEPGGYRLFAYIRDPAGNAAVANIPVLVKGKEAVAGAKTALPFVLYQEKEGKEPYAPTGWMGNTGAIAMDPGWTEKPAIGKTCMRVSYNANDQWGGVVWQNPAGDWGDMPGGFDLRGAKRLVFKARGASGGEVVTFKFGLLGSDKKVSDTATAELANVTLTPEWKEFSIPLTGKDLTRIKTGFCWTVAGQGKPLVFFLDDIRFE